MNDHFYEDTDAGLTGQRFSEADEDGFPEETAENSGKSAQRRSWEEQFSALYEEYMRPAKTYSAYRIQCQLDDLYLLLCKLNRGWAYRKAESYKLAGFTDADGEEALSIGCAYVYGMLMEDRENGSYCPYPIGHYLSIAQNKTIDGYFRTKFGRLPAQKKAASDDEEAQRRRKLPYTVSLDAPISDDNGEYRGERLSEASTDPFANPQRSRLERDDKSNRLVTLFIRELMDYPSDPPKPIALMYGSILFQLYKDYGGNDELSLMAKKSTKISSPEWAHQRMGNATLQQLGIYAERTVQKCYNKSLSWGSALRRNMLERVPDGSGQKWADIVYTKTYTVGNTSDWIESISKSTMIKCARKLKDSPELKEFAVETFSARSKFRKALEKMRKGDSDDTSV